MANVSDLSFLTKFNISFTPKVSLRELTTFQLGGPCLGVIFCETPEQLEQSIQELSQRCIDFILLGEGSNILASYSGIEKIVVRYLTNKPSISLDQTELVLPCSTRLDDLVQFSIDQGLEGLAFASGIPGTVGGAIVGNAGAFGKQIGDFVESVEIIDRNAKKWIEPASKLGFQYRHSKFKENNQILVSAKFRLQPGNRAALQKERNEVLDLRKEKHPDYKKTPTAGSFFKNIEPTSQAERRQAAGWFLEQSGAKSFVQNGAMTFEKHANIIIKKGNCTAQDVFDLSLRMEKTVEEKFRLCLIREVRLLGAFKGISPSIVSDFH